MKKVIAVLLAASIVCAAVPAAAAGVTATKNASNVMVDGKPIAFDAYTINGNNFFKLRDIAAILSGTAKQFGVTWDGEKEAINLVDGEAYALIGGELVNAAGGETKQAVRSTSDIYLDGKEVDMTAYTINDNNYFKLRDLGMVFDFGVEWNRDTSTVAIESMLGYTPEGGGDSYGHIDEMKMRGTHAGSATHWASVASVQQFLYKDEGMAYAYAKETKLEIRTASKTLSIHMQYPLLGDVIADDIGNFYVVWGKENTTTDAQIETVFISKYTPDGILIKNTGFVGASSPWGDDDSAKTKLPFDAGNCVSAIANGVLVNYHAKERYDGHQSDTAIAVNIADMSPHALPNNTYTGHSFNQSIIYSTIADDFMFASQGDAFSRGFRVNFADGEYGDENETIFTFYLEANAGYDMYIVNETFAQLGGLAETSAGVVLVGASAKSIGEAAKTEKQNLFIQIFDPLAENFSQSAFLGGTTRSGATSYDIYDSQNTPLTPVTDYGVNWLTQYTDRDVVAPQVVVVDDKIVILWSEVRQVEVKTPVPIAKRETVPNTDNEIHAAVTAKVQEVAAEAATRIETTRFVNIGFYTVLSAEGAVIKPATSLGTIKLNTYERPIVHNGLISWAYVDGGTLKVVTLKP